MYNEQINDDVVMNRFITEQMNDNELMMNRGTDEW